MRTFDIVICGAGVVGLTLARELAGRGRRRVLVVEKEQGLGRHASGRNSGVLHAGVYYARDSLRARTCLEGNRRMKDYCRLRGLPLLETGKVIVARSPAELPGLTALFERARDNGAAVRMIDEAELAAIEPNARTAGQALYSPETAVVEPRRVLDSLAGELRDQGLELAFGVKVLGLRGRDVLVTDAGEIGFGLFINAAGAHADTVARHFGLGGRYRSIPFKGIYRKLRPERAATIRGSVYPVPDPRNPFLGVHFTRGASGGVYIGPTAIPALGRENYGLLSGIDAEAPAILWRDASLFVRNPKFRAVALTEPRKYWFPYFFRDAQKLVKELLPSDLEATDKAGIRPQLVDWETGELVMDFVIERADNSLHILNAISPAFTASLAFSEMVAADHLA